MLLKDAIEAHVESKRAAGARSATLDGTRRALTSYFAGILDTPVGRLTAARAQHQYEQLRQLAGPRTGQPLAIATQQTYLGLAKTFCRWLLAKGWLRDDPTTKVRAVGRRRRGKPQLRADEICQLRDTCLDEASEGSTAVLMCMLMAMRVSEVVSRCARDIDLGGTILRVDDNLAVRFQTKTDSSKRPIKIPQVLQPPLALLAAGKGTTEPLFPGSVGGRKRRQWLHGEAQRLCKKAGVPVVCPHSLRGAMATIAVEAGELPEVVARVLGHTSSKMTLQHYIAPGVAEAAQLARGQAALAAAKTAPLPA
jgi:integrase